MLVLRRLNSQKPHTLKIKFTVPQLPLCLQRGVSHELGDSGGQHTSMRRDGHLGHHLLLKTTTPCPSSHLCMLLNMGWAQPVLGVHIHSPGFSRYGATSFHFSSAPGHSWHLDFCSELLYSDYSLLCFHSMDVYKLEPTLSFWVRLLFLLT